MRHIAVLPLSGTRNRTKHPTNHGIDVPENSIDTKNASDAGGLESSESKCFPTQLLVRTIIRTMGIMEKLYDSFPADP